LSGENDSILKPGGMSSLFEIPNQMFIINTLQRLEKAKPGEKDIFIDEAAKYLGSDEPDHHKAWACTALEFIGGKKAYDCLEGAFLNASKGDRLTRHFALKGMRRLAGGKEKEDLLTHCRSIFDDEKEQNLLRLSAASVLVAEGVDPDKKYDNFLMEYISNVEKNEWKARPPDLKVFRDFPAPSLQQYLCRIAENDEVYLEARARSIEALGALALSAKKGTVKTLGTMLTDQRNDRSLRLGAAQALLSLRGLEAGQELLAAVANDEDAEVREQATNVLTETLDTREAVKKIVESAMQTKSEDAARAHLVAAIRKIDKERAISSDILMKMMMERDVDKAKVAEEMLMDIGGWRAFQGLAQRSRLIEKTDELLKRTEEEVFSLYNRTISRAELNFRFAMYVNAIIVGIGVVLIALGVVRLGMDPTNYADWAGPGGGGLFMFLVTRYLDNPRRNGREDLGVLIMSNIIFLGFLRKLSEIDATFKHLYLEKVDFTAEDSDATVKQIEAATKTTLDEMGTHLGLCFKPETTTKTAVHAATPT